MSAKQRLEQACLDDPAFKVIWDNVQLRFQKGLSQNSVINSETTEEIAPKTVASSSSTSITDAQVQKLVDEYYWGHANQLYKIDFPFYAEGIVVKVSADEKMLDIYSRRMGKIKVEDNKEKRKGLWFGYWLEVGENQHRGMKFLQNPRCIKSVKFGKNDGFLISGFALIGFSRNNDETKWVGWNDVTGWMKGYHGAARLSKNKHSDRGFSVEVVKYTAKFNNDRFEMNNITLLTDQHFQEHDFPEQAIYVRDLVFVDRNGTKCKFTSKILGLNCVIDENQTMVDYKPNMLYEGIIVPHFLSPQNLEWRGLVLLTAQLSEAKNFSKLKLCSIKNKNRLFGSDNNENFVMANETRASHSDITIIKDE